MERFKHIDKDILKTDNIPPFIITGDDADQEKTNYSNSLDLGPAYRYDESVTTAIQCLIKMKSRASEGGVTFSLLLNEMNMYNMKLEPFQVNTNFLNTLPPEWSKFVTDVKLVRDLHTTEVDQLHAYLCQHVYHANEVRLMHERHSDPLALISQHQLNRPTYQHHHQSYHQPKF
nr:hypothetical protein [Tanacetum cinerariifolium]